MAAPSWWDQSSTYCIQENHDGAYLQVWPCTGEGTAAGEQWILKAPDAIETWMENDWELVNKPGRRCVSTACKPPASATASPSFSPSASPSPRAAAAAIGPNVGGIVAGVLLGASAAALIVYVQFFDGLPVLKAASAKALEGASGVAHSLAEGWRGGKGERTSLLATQPTTSQFSAPTAI